MTLPGSGTQRPELDPVVPASQQPPQAQQPSPRPAEGPAVSLRSVLLGLLGVAVIAGYSDINGLIIQPGVPLAASHLPIFPVAIVFLLASIWNPLMGRVRESFRLRIGELTVVMLLMLAAAWVPGYGMLRTFPIQLIRPWVIQNQDPSWQKEHTLDHIPDHLVPLHHRSSDPSYQRVFGEFEGGIAVHGGKHLPITMTPWKAWLPVMVYWVPLFILFAIALSALAALVHRQWSKHEQLAYPLAAIYASLLPGPGGGVPAILRTKLFWLGTIPPLIFHLNNWGAMMTHGHYFPWIQDSFWPGADITRVIPILAKAGYNGCGFIQFAIMGIAYFVPSEVGLSMATGYMLFILTSIPIYLITGSPMPGPDAKNVMAGAFIMYGAILLITGRSYYLATIRKAFTRIAPTDLDQTGPWAARILLLSSVSLIALLNLSFGLDWLMASIYVASLLLFFLVVTRVVCETGIPFFQAEFDMGIAMSTLLGFPVIGPNPLVIITWLGSILNFDTRVCLMPFAANGLKLAETTGLRLRPVIPWVLVSVLLALSLGLVTKIWTTYGVGSERDNYHILVGLSASTLTQATTGLVQLDQTAQMTVASSMHGLAKLTLLGHNSGHGRDLAFMLFGAIGIVLFCLARFRFAGFPLHPVVFLIWGTWPSQFLWFSFFVGWAMKKMVVVYGGPGYYHRGKPFFLGLIIGETMIAAFFVLTQLCYYLLTGTAIGSGMGYG